MSSTYFKQWYHPAKRNTSYSSIYRGVCAGTGLYKATVKVTHCSLLLHGLIRSTCTKAGEKTQEGILGKNVEDKSTGKGAEWRLGGAVISRGPSFRHTGREGSGGLFYNHVNILNPTVSYTHKWVRWWMCKKRRKQGRPNPPVWAYEKAPFLSDTTGQAGLLTAWTEMQSEGSNGDRQHTALLCLVFIHFSKQSSDGWSSGKFSKAFIRSLPASF